LASLGPPQRPATEGVAPAATESVAPARLSPPAPPQGPAYASPRSPPDRDEVSPWAAGARARSAGAGGWGPAPPRPEGVPAAASPLAPPRSAEAATTASPSAPARVSIPQGTADIAEFVPRPSLPFQASQPPSAGQSAPEGKRLQRFDPQTGKPLDPPLWADALPAPGDEGKR
ncbi:MAG TPA: hypothetical protein VL242_50090, partial [Sorangium sp.]|nr:hypothetical protein [Sorangium sp.]